jgi:hypothetical protein
LSVSALHPAHADLPVANCTASGHGCNIETTEDFHEKPVRPAAGDVLSTCSRPPPHYVSTASNRRAPVLALPATLKPCLPVRLGFISTALQRRWIPSPSPFDLTPHTITKMLQK